MNNRGNVLVNANLLMLGFISICCIMFNCTHDLPPMSEYQIIEFTPVGAAYQGEISVYHDTLIVLYWERDFYPCHIRKYYVGDPKEPVIADIDEFDFYYQGYLHTVVNEDSFLFILEPYRPSSIRILNLNSLTVKDVSVDYDIYGLTYDNNMLFLTADSGLRVWDISDLNNIIELYNEGDTNSRWQGQIAQNDTILFECYNDGVSRFKFWNVHDPQNPTIIAEGHTDYYFDQIDITDQYIIAETSGMIFRFAYDFTDSLIFEDSLYLECGAKDLRIKDSLVCLNCYSFLLIFEIDNFDENWRLYQLSSHYYHLEFLSYAIYQDKIYALIKEKGVYIYERSE